ncbi:MAG: FecR domain-containing protein, partial [Candidatus Omnitrophica bacterium]|nr:FecR domain-containing protein [Candidatus Omnitrophota bacterium]
MYKRIYAVCLRLLLTFLLVVNTIPPTPLFAQEQKALKNKRLEKNQSFKPFVEVISVQGAAQVQKAQSSDWVAADKGTQLYSQDKIRTLIDSLAQLQYPDASTLSLRENSLLTIQDISRDPKTKLIKRELKLDVGGMKYKVSRLREKGSEFKMRTSTAIVGVTGTEGTILTEGDDKPTTNILTEGNTYNTDEDGKNGRPLNPGNGWSINNDAQSDKYMLGEDDKNENSFLPMDKATLTRFNDFMTKLNEKMNQGYAMQPVSSLVAQLNDAFMRKDAVTVNTLLDQIEELLGGLVRPTDEEAQRVNELLQKIITEIETMATEGYDLTQVDPLLYKAQELYQSGNYSEAETIATQIFSMLPNLEKKESDFEVRLKEFMAELNEKSKEGYMVDEIAEMVKRSAIAYASGRRGQAEELLAQARKMLVTTKRAIPEELLKAFEEIKTQVANKKKEGFQVTILEGLITQAEKARAENEYLSFNARIIQLKGLLAQELEKIMPDDLRLALNAFEDLLKKKQDAGFDTTSLQTIAVTIYAAKDKGNFTALRNALAQAQNLLAQLSMPQPLRNHFQAVKDDVQKKKDEGYEVTELENLLLQIQASLDKGALNDARLLLTRADELLEALTDTQPPTLQVNIVFSDDGLTVRVLGIAHDNIGIAWISVNGDLVSANDAGNFTKELLWNSALREVRVETQDINNNLAPEVIIPLPADKLKSPAAGDNAVPVLNAEDIRLTYIMPDQLKIDGTTEPGVIVDINARAVYTNSAGAFSTQLHVTQELFTRGLRIVAKNEQGNSSVPLDIPFEDKWPPLISEVRIKILDTIPPVLTVDPLEYAKQEITIRGSCHDVANIVIEGTIEDLGTGMNEVTLNGIATPLEDGSFKTTLALTPELTQIQISAADAAGNTVTDQVTVDAPPVRATVYINDEEIPLGSNGAFTATLIALAQLHQVVVRAKDTHGNEATPVQLVVADVVPPLLFVGDLSYRTDSVELSGTTEPYARVSDTSAQLFTQPVSADERGIFKTTFPRPASIITATLKSEDASGNTSETVSLTVEPLEDSKPPFLTVANLDYSGNTVIVSGKAEDDSGAPTVSINGRRVELIDGIFREEFQLSEDLVKFEIVARDASGKSTTVVRVVADTINPEIILESLEYEDGYCLVKGSATDNIGLKEVYCNDTPIEIPLPEGGTFQYRLLLSAQTKEVTVSAVDLYGNYAESSPLPIQLPADSTAPAITLNELSYRGSTVIVSGTATDNIGIQSVTINTIPVNVYEDGSFQIEIPIEVGTPIVVLNDATYENGLLTVSGRANLGAQSPSSITAQAEDLSGNMSQPVEREIAPIELQDLKILVNDERVDLEEGAFSATLPLERAMADITVLATDPLGNASAESTLALERIPPIVTTEELRYGESQVTISGSATDTGSGVAEVLVNGTPAEVENDGTFSYTATIAESTINVVAIDRLGNMASAPPITIELPDKNPPLFVLKVNPLPAIIGKNVFITIDALDSKTRLPEILPVAPEVKVTLPSGESKVLAVNGAGASFDTLLDTTGSTPGTVTIEVKGKDQAGNTGDTTEGTASFILADTDMTSPSLRISVIPPAPVEAGSTITIQVTSSKTLKTLPKAEIRLPGDATFELPLEGSISGTTFTKNFLLPTDVLPGEAAISAADAVDASGNPQAQKEEFKFLITAAAADEARFAIRLDSPQISAQKISARGRTAAGAMVHINVGPIPLTVPADENGKFTFTRELTAEDIETLSRAATNGFIHFSCYASNYAGLKSETISLLLPLPTLAAAQAQGNLVVEIQPENLPQGKAATIRITSRSNLTQPPRAVIKFSDGSIEPLVVRGAKTEFTAVYTSTTATRPGPAIIEARAETSFSTRSFAIVPAMGTGAGLYMVSATPDPGIIGQEIECTVRAQRSLTQTPRLSIRLPNGRIEQISLSGQDTTFKGKYLCPATMPAGPAELIINDGEFRRPYGIAPAFAGRAGLAPGNFIITTNPSPLSVGSAATVLLKSAEPLNFLPKIDVRLPNGRFISTPLAGATPGNEFRGSLNLPADAPSGPAAIIAKNEQGQILAEVTTTIVPNYQLEAAGGIEVFMLPFNAMAGQQVTINVNAKRRPFAMIPQAKMTFGNGLVLPVRLEGTLPSPTLQGRVLIPQGALPGQISITVVDDTGKTIGVGMGTIGGGTGLQAGDIRIQVLPPFIMPGSTMEVLIHSDAPLLKLPKVILEIPDKGPRDLRVEGPVPGNRFRAITPFPGDARVRGSKILVRFDPGDGEKTRTIDLEGAGADELPEFRPPQLTPPIPIPGQPLVLTLFAPKTSDFIPKVRVNYINGSTAQIPMSGPIPGDTFSGTLASVLMPIKTLDVIDPEDNNILITLPIEIFSGTGSGVLAPPRVEILPPPPLMPPVMAKLKIDFPMPVPALPRVLFQFPDGKNIPVFINGAVPGVHFEGVFSIPSDAANGQANLQIFVNEQMIPNLGMPPITIGYGASATSGDLLQMQGFSSGCAELSLSWYVLPNAATHRITYQAPGVAPQTINLARLGRHVLTALTTGLNYDITLSARDSRGIEIARSQRTLYVPACGSAEEGTSGFPLRVSSSGPTSLQINWDPQQNAKSYEVYYALGSDPESRAPVILGNQAAYLLSDLSSGTYTILVKAVLSTQEKIASRREIVTLGSTNTRFPPPPVSFSPNPPIVGKPLTIQFMVPMVVPMPPKVGVRYETRGEEFPTVKGATPGSSFSAQIASVKEKIYAINFYDPTRGDLIHSFPVGAGASGPGSGTITNTPENPVLGQALSISFQTTAPQVFSPYARFIFTAGPPEDVLMYGPPMGTKFTYTYNTLTKSVQRIEIWDNTKANKIAEKPFSVTGTSPSGSGCWSLSASPALQIATPSTITLRNTCNQSVNQTPYIRIYFSNGNMREFSTSGTTPGATFTLALSAQDTATSVQKIEAWDNTKTIKLAELSVAVFSGGGLYPPPVLTPDPPVPNTSGVITFPVNLAQAPFVRLIFSDGTQTESLMSGSSGSFTYTYAPLVKFLQRVEIWDNSKANKLSEKGLGGMLPPTGAEFMGTLTVSPDPPAWGSALNVNFASTDTQTNQPYIRFFYTDGSQDFRLMSGSDKNFSYYYSGLNKSLQRIEIWDSTQTKKKERSFTIQTGISEGQISVSPDPPVLATILNVNFLADWPQDITPYVRFFYEDGSQKDELMSGQAGGTTFTYSHTALNKNVQKIEVWDHGRTNRLGEKAFGTVVAGCPEYILEVRPYRPSIGLTMTIVVDLPLNIPPLSSRPVAKINYEGGPTETINLPNGMLPGWHFEGSTIMQKKITSIDIDIPGVCIKNHPAPELSDWPTPIVQDPNPYPLTPGITTYFPISFPSMVPAKPVVNAIFSDNTLEELEVTGTVPGQSFSARLESDKFKYTTKLKIEVFDDEYQFLNIREFSLSNEYPTGILDEDTGICSERRIRWNTVSNAAGYDIYCGLSNPPSTLWKEVIGNINSEIITGLTCGQRYYYRVTVHGATSYEKVSYFTAGGASSTLEILNIPTIPNGWGDVTFEDTNPGATTNSITFGVKNNGIASITLRKKSGTGTLSKVNDFTKTISSSYVSAPESITIMAGNSATESIYISIPGDAATGDYQTLSPPLVYYEDINHNGTQDVGESDALFLLLSVYVGTFIEGIGIAEEGVDFGSVSAGSSSSNITLHVSNSITSNLLYIKVDLPTMYREGGGATISSSAITFSLNSSYTGVLGVGETALSTVSIAIPEGQTTGTYYGTPLRIYNDIDNDNTFDDGAEPYEYLSLMVVVGESGLSSTVTDLTATNRGTGGAVDL